jgi:mannose-6-phosphate isomerase
MSEMTDPGAAAWQVTVVAPQHTDKPWGHEELLIRGSYVLKRLYVRGGQRLSLQYHEHKVETLVVTSGQAEILLDGVVCRYGPGEIVHVPAGVTHRIGAGAGDVELLEASTPELDDVVRVEDDYGRSDQA